MKKLITLCLSLFVCVYGHAQTTIYSQNFNSGTYPEWTLNSTTTIDGISGTNNAPTGNEWLVNAIYAGGPIGTATTHEPAGITGYPTSTYLHMNCGSSFASLYGSNDNYLASGTGEVYMAVMTTPQVTTGYTNVYFSFWWLCLGDAADDGNLYYSTNGGTTWTQITGVDFYGSSTWAVDSIHLAAFDNQASLQFAFTFTDGDAGASDPEFGIDDISLHGTSGSVAPVASFTTTATTACQDSCITFTSTSTGSPTSYSWTTSPATATIGTATASATSICFPPSGAFSVTLTATNGTGSNSTTSVINITPTPHPVITQSGHMLSVPSGYTTYQWFNGLSPITGATSNTYTFTTEGLYGIEVDSAGCIGGDTLTTSTTHVANVYNSATNFWIAQPNGSSISINTSKPLNDALYVTIYDATGRELLNETWDAGSFTKQINGLSVASGLYIIKLSNNYTSAVLKWLKP